MFYALLFPGIWTAWVIYWYAAGRNAKAVRRQESVASRAAHIVPLSIAIALFVLPETGRGWLSARFLPFSVTTYWIGVAILLAGLAFTIAARRHLGGNWSGTVTVKQDHELIRSGPYGLVRHPIYTGLLVGFTGSAVALGEIRGLIAIALVLIACLIKIRLEERWMTESFGDAYRQYRTAVRALIPFVI